MNVKLRSANFLLDQQKKLSATVPLWHEVEWSRAQWSAWTVRIDWFKGRTPLISAHSGAHSHPLILYIFLLSFWNGFATSFLKFWALSWLPTCTKNWSKSVPGAIQNPSQLARRVRMVFFYRFLMNFDPYLGPRNHWKSSSRLGAVHILLILPVRLLDASWELTWRHVG